MNTILHSSSDDDDDDDEDDQLSQKLPTKNVISTDEYTLLRLLESHYISIMK